jgi:hypothetical protein
MLCTAQTQILARTPVHPYFSVHHFLMNSAIEIGAFAQFSPNFYHGHSATMKFIQFHSDNRNSTFATTMCCWLTFLGRVFPKLIHELRILIN